MFINAIYLSLSLIYKHVYIYMILIKTILTVFNYTIFIIFNYI